MGRRCFWGHKLLVLDASWRSSSFNFCVTLSRCIYVVTSIIYDEKDDLAAAWQRATTAGSTASADDDISTSNSSSRHLFIFLAVCFSAPAGDSNEWSSQVTTWTSGKLLHTEHVSGAWAADFPLTAQAYFCDTRSPLRSRSPDFPLPRSRSAPLTCSDVSDAFRRHTSVSNQ